MLDINESKLLLSTLRARHANWYWTSVAFLVLTVVFWSAQWIDERTLLGVSVWSKPFKFSLSFSVYFMTLLLMAGFVREEFWRARSGRILVGTLLFMASFEMVYMVWQAAQGEASHFNEATPFHSIMYALMGVGAVTLVSMLVWFAVEIGRQVRWQLTSQPLVFAVVVGLILTFVLGGGFGGYLSSNGSHFVGPSISDANGLWLVKWAREVGDLRVAHFFGMHAMQVVPLFALMLPSAMSSRAQIAAITAFSVAYSGFATATFVQALNGQPFIG